MPVEGLKEWMAKPEEERKVAEAKMKGDWDTWLASHKDSVQNTIGLGATKRVRADGVTDTNNGLMLSSYVAGNSVEEVAEMFKNHPHLDIPGATIDVMEVKPL